MIQRIPLLEVGPVALSATATIHLEQLIGRRVLGLILEFGYTGGTNTIASSVLHITEMRLIINDQVKRRVSGLQWRDLLLKNGLIYDAQGLPNTAPGVALTIPFAEAWRQDRDQREITSLPTVWGGGKQPRQSISNFRVELDIGAAIAGSSAPTIIAWADVDDVIPDIATAAMVEWIPMFFPAGGAEFTASLNRSGVLVAMQLYRDSLNGRVYTRAKLVVDEITRHDLGFTSNFADLTFNGMVPLGGGARTVGIYDIILDRDDNLSKAVNLNGASSAALTLTATGGAMGGNVVSITELIRPILS